MLVMDKLDLKKEDKAYYSAKAIPSMHDFDKADYITISGVSAPDAPLFLNSIAAIYPVAYTIKRFCREEGRDFVVPKMEAFWWVESALPFDEVPRAEWYWQVLIRMPEYVTTAHVEEAIQHIIETKDTPLVNEVNHQQMNAGKFAQILHVGSYDEEKASLDKLYQFIEDQQSEIIGYHKEIYLSDPRKTAPEKLRTILRYEVK
jgi:hypothetical protein